MSWLKTYFINWSSKLKLILICGLLCLALLGCNRMASPQVVRVPGAGPASTQEGTPTNLPPTAEPAVFSTAAPSATVSPTTSPTTQPQIQVRAVRVTQGTGVYFQGESTLPAGACLKTEFWAGDQPVTWWPKDVCIEAENNQWEMLVPLGQKGAPSRLDPQAQYELRVWWPQQPTQTLVRFPFDLQGPSQ